MPASKTGTAAKVSGSSGAVPKSSFAIKPHQKDRPASPRHVPAPIITAARPSTSRSTSSASRSHAQPDPELARALNHQVVHHAVDPDRRHHQSQQRERRQDHGAETRLRHRSRDQLLHRLDPVHRRGAIDRRHRRASTLPPRRPASSDVRTHDRRTALDVRPPARPACTSPPSPRRRALRAVHRRPRRPRCATSVRRNAAAGRPGPRSPQYWRAIDALITTTHGESARVRRRERSSAQQRNPDRLEIPRTHRPVFRHVVHARRAAADGPR